MHRAVICRQLAAVTVITCSLIASWFAYSQRTTTPETTAEEKSFYLGKPVTHPEELSGIWEAPDGHGGAIGIHLILHTTASAWLSLEVGIYKRAGAVLQFGEENFFVDSPRGGNVRYDDGLLRLHAQKFDLDLSRISEDRWSGRIRRNGFDSAVILTRLGVGTAKTKPWFVGTWNSGDQSIQSCIHISEQAPGKFVGWRDSLTARGAVRRASGIPKPPDSFESYGDLVKIATANDDSVSIELNAFNGMCCSHLFLGTPEDNGTVMKELSPTEPNQPPHQTKWKKMSGNTCIVTPPDLPANPENSESQCPEK